MTYVHLTSKSDLPDVSLLRPFRAVVVVEDEILPERQALISQWLVQSGCLYMMAWGKECSSWDDAVDLANLEEFNFRDVPEDACVMTTWHESESLKEVFWFCKNSAFHPTVELTNNLVLHLASNSGEEELTSEFADA